MVVRLALLAVVALLAPAAAVRADDLDPHIPPDTERYISINVKQIVTSPVGKKIGKDNLKSLFENLEQVNELLKELEVDPLEDIERVQIASPNSAESDRGLMILAGKLDSAKLKKKADDAVNDVEPRVRAHKAPLGNKEFHPIYELKPGGQDTPLFVAILENKTLLASGGKDYVVDALKQARAQKKPTLKDRQVQTVLEKLDPKLAIALAVRGGALPKLDLLDLIPQGIRNAMDSVEVIGGGAAFSNEIRFNLVGSSKTADDAATLRDTLTRGFALIQVGLKFLGNENKVVNLLGDVLNTVKVGGKDKVVSLSAKLTADVLDDFNKKD